MFMKHYAPNRCEPSIEALNFGRGGGGGAGIRADVNGEVFLYLIKTSVFPYMYRLDVVMFTWKRFNDVYYFALNKLSPMSVFSIGIMLNLPSLIV